MKTLGILCAASLALVGPVGAELGRTVDGGDGLYLLEDLAGVAIVEEGAPEPLELAPQAGFRELVRLEGGWIATGTEPGEHGSDLLLVARGADGVELLPTPAASGALERSFPVPFVEAGRLVGLAWLEGETTQTAEVRAAAWTGDGWSEPQVVSPRGPGSQIAPAAAVLADGSWLLVWSAYDGEDTDIYWSERRDGGWRVPERLHPDDGEPDIVPALAPHGVGAIAAWSGFDGSDYRLRLARFERGSWVLDDDFRGARGTLYPRFVARGGVLGLLAKQAVPAAWTLLELGPEGRPARALTVADETGTRPLVEELDASGAVLVWPEDRPDTPGRRAAAAWAPRR